MVSITRLIFGLFVLTSIVYYLFNNVGKVTRSNEEKQYIFVASARHHLKNVVRQLDHRGMLEYQLPQKDTTALWKQVSSLLPSQWQIIWSFQTIRYQYLPHLSKHHRVNHIPGNDVIVVKPQLWRTIKRINPSFMPRHYMLPDDLSELKKVWSSSRWITKSVNHRGVKFLENWKEVEELSSNMMVAEYVEPLLIDNRKWDIGVYVAVTSLEPLTIYIYDNVLLRICKLDYPIDGKLNKDTPVDSYVVNGYVPPWDIPTLAKEYHGDIPSSFKEGKSNWEALNNYFIKNNIVKEKHQLKQNVYNIVTTTITRVASTLHSAVKKYGGWPDTFFELWRWDFVISREGKVKIMEVNMSPNLMPKHFKSGTDEMMKRHLTKYLLRIVGAGGYDTKTIDDAYRYESIAKRYVREHVEQITRLIKSKKKDEYQTICSERHCKGCPNKVEKCFICLEMCYYNAPVDVRRKLKKLLYGYISKGQYHLVTGGFHTVDGIGVTATTRTEEDNEHNERQNAAAWLMSGDDDDSTNTPLPKSYYDRAYANILLKDTKRITDEHSIIDFNRRSSQTNYSVFYVLMMIVIIGMMLLFWSYCKDRILKRMARRLYNKTVGSLV